MFYLRYILAELRRRKGRTILTALGLAIGVGLVVTVTALSTGLDRAQSEVLRPLTGVGTDMTVTRPLTVSGEGSDQGFRPGPGGPGLSQDEQDELREENGGQRFGLNNLGEPGESFSTDNFMTTQLSFPESEIESVEGISGVEDAAPALTLNAVHVSGNVPEDSGQQGGGPGGFGGGPGGPPDSIKFDQMSVAGVDASKPDLGPLTSGQVQSGSYFTEGKKRQAILSQSYAKRKQLKVGDSVKLGGKTFDVVGVAQPPLGGQASDVYVQLGELQKISDRDGRVNTIAVRADSADDVGAVSRQIEQSINGAEVTTSKDLADRVSGSLVDAKSISNKLGTALAIVGLAAAFLIASLLTLASVNKRVRELGTLKAVGWSQRLVIRQVTGESLAQGLLGGAIGALIGIGGAALITAFGPTLKATVESASRGAGFGPGGPGGPGGPPGAGMFGQGQVEAGSSVISLTAPIDVSLIALAIGLALLGGLIAGAIGGTRAARLRPAEALRSIE